jgi:molecular chaperone DnaK (HSP70)
MSQQKSFLEELLPHQINQQKALLKDHEKAQKIIERATKKANQILIQSNFFHKSLKESLRQELKDAVQSSVQTYQKELESAVKKSLNDLQAIIKQQLKDNQEFLQNKTKDQWSLIEKDLSDYKEERKRETDKMIRDKVGELVSETFVKTMPESMKEKLIFEALEAAKKDGLFNNS